MLGKLQTWGPFSLLYKNSNGENRGHLWVDSLLLPLTNKFCSSSGQWGKSVLQQMTNISSGSLAPPVLTSVGHTSFSSPGEIGLTRSG